MAITFLQQEKRQKYLILILVGVILLTFFVVWRGFLFKPKAVLAPTISEPPEIEINFQTLKSPLLKELQPYQEIEPLLEEEMGRENPFIPY